MSFEVKVVKKGYLHKRGEYVKTWRKRYFILFSDGDFSGFRTMESVEAESGEKQNNFTVEGCQIIKKNFRLKSRLRNKRTGDIKLGTI